MPEYEDLYNGWDDLLTPGFESIKKGDRLRFTVNGCRFRYATADQDVEINDYHRDHPERQYVNLRWDNPATPYTDNWEHRNDTVWGPEHESYPCGIYEEGKDPKPAYTDDKRWQTGKYVRISREIKEEVSMSNIEAARAAIYRAASELAAAKKQLEEASKPKEKTKEAFAAELSEVRAGSLVHFRIRETDPATSGSINYVKTYGNKYGLYSDAGEAASANEMYERGYRYIVVDYKNTRY